MVAVKLLYGAQLVEKMVDRILSNHSVSNWESVSSSVQQGFILCLAFSYIFIITTMME